MSPNLAESPSQFDRNYAVGSTDFHFWPAAHGCMSKRAGKVHTRQEVALAHHPKGPLFQPPQDFQHPHAQI
jgi:hypothetical protein